MDKESSLISRIKNGIMSIISRLKERNTEPGATEEKEQPVDSEHISRSENKTETHSPENEKQLIVLKKELRESIDAILNKLFDGISGLLEEEYKDRLIGLERRIEELKKKGEEELVSHLNAYKGELDEVRNLAKTAKLSSEENIEKIAKISIEESEIEELKGKIEKIGETKLPDVLRDESKGTTIVSNYTKQAPEGVLKTIRNLEESEILEFKNKLEKIRDMKLSDISDDKLNGITTVLDYIKQAPEGDIGMIRSLKESEIEELKEKIEKIEEMKLNDISDDKLKGITTVLDYLKQVPEEDIKTIKASKNLEEEVRKIGETGITDVSTPPEELERFRQIMSLYTSISKGDNKVPELDENRLLLEFLDSLEERMNKMNIHLFYNEGVILLKKGTFRNAYEYFNEITTMNQNLKGAWLNRGFALGKLGNIDEEIISYKKALSIDEKYEKALHNMKIAERKNRKSER